MPNVMHIYARAAPIGIPLIGSPGTENFRVDRDMTYLIVESDRAKSLTKKSKGCRRGQNAPMDRNISRTINRVHSEYSIDASLHR